MRKPVSPTTLRAGGAKAIAISGIRKLVAAHARPGWDGEEAEPISDAAGRLAEAFISALPNDVPIPEIAPEPDGSISLDWIQSQNRLLTLSIGITDRLAYAWLDGTDGGHAVARFDLERIPEQVLAGIRETMLTSHGSVE